MLKMKILRVIASMNPKSGGPCQGIRNSIPHINKLGIVNEVVCMDNQSVRYDTNDNFIIHKIGKGKTSYQYQPLLYNWLINNALNYDFVIVQGLWQYHNLAVYNAIKFLKRKNVKVPKVVIMPHGMLDPYFQKASDRKWKALRNEIVWRFLEKKCINQAEALFFTCQEELNLASTTFKGYNPKKTMNVGYGIQAPPENNFEFKKAFEQKCSTIQGKKYWLFLSRIHEKKGVDLLIKAYDIICQQNSSLPELVIAGPTDSHYAQEMIALTTHNPKIHFSGMLQGDAKWGAFYGCEIYLLPSYQENFGIAIVEAMACKKPVLISKNINIWKEIEDGDGGWILNELNINSIKEQLLNISFIDNEVIITKGENANNVYKNEFDVENCADVFVNALKTL